MAEKKTAQNEGAENTSAAKKPAQPKTTEKKETQKVAKNKAPQAQAKAADKKGVKQEKKPSSPNRLNVHYTTVVVPALVKHFNYGNVNQAPRLEKITLNSGLGDIKDNSKSFQVAVEELRQISGQKPVITKAKKSVANFKVREGMNVGAKVTLRGKRMYEFMDKLISIAMPRIRDFRGVSDKSFDGRGNYTMGVKEQLIFPEITYDQVEKTRGFDITFVTTAKTDEEAKQMLKLMGMPFRA